MNNVNHCAKAKKYLWLWIISFFTVGNMASIYIKKFEDSSYLTLQNVPNWYLLTVVALVMLYFVPLLVRMGYHAKMSNMKKTILFSRIMLFQHILWLALLLFEMLSALMFGG